MSRCPFDTGETPLTLVQQCLPRFPDQFWIVVVRDVEDHNHDVVKLKGRSKVSVELQKGASISLRQPMEF